MTTTVLPELALTVSAPAGAPAAPTPSANPTGDIPFVDIPELAIGEELPVTVTLFNYSHRPQSGSLSLSVPEGLTASPASVRFSDIADGATAKAVITVTARASQPAGQVTVTAAADLGPGNADAHPAKLALSVISAVTITASPSPLQLVATQPGPVTVTATSNLLDQASATVSISAPASWVVTPASSAITLDPGQPQTVTFTVTPPPGTFGSQALQVVANAGATSTTLSLPASVATPIAIVGTPGDTNNDEFALAPDHYASYPATFPDDVDFTYGTSDPATDWSYIQPGPEDPWGGSQTHTFTFRFSLDQSPSSDLTFMAWLLDTNNVFPPTVQVGLNGATLQSIALPGGGGDGYHWGDGQPNTFAGITPTTFSVTLPAGQCVAGQNAVTVTTGAGGSWIVYEAFGVLQQPSQT